ncbi:MAG: uridine kinase [Herbinix sp.]|jgi:uridine kinase|nr:uridine kinase [Herbinix sp.]
MIYHTENKYKRLIHGVRRMEIFKMNNKVKSDYRPVLEAIEELLKKDKPVIVAIDGMCGSGKSYLASILAATFDCNVFHMDDYFVPLEMKKEDRLAQPGGNVHYERFKEEVINSLVNNWTVTYRPYLCGLWRLGEEVVVEPKKLTIIEGTYSLHPELRNAYSITVFLSIDKNKQLERILERNGEEKLKQFIDKWIPLESLYFDHLGIPSLCDITLDTTNF